MYSFRLGTLVLNGQLLLFILFGIAGYAMLRLWLRRRHPDAAPGLADAAGTAFVLWLAVWKLSPLLIDYRVTSENWSSLLFLDGGAMGQLLAAVSVVVYAAYRAGKTRLSPRLLGEAAAVFVAGGTIAYQAALLAVRLDPPAFAALTLAWALAYALAALYADRRFLAAGLPGAVFFAGLALLAFAAEHRLPLLPGLSSQQLACLALALWLPSAAEPAAPSGDADAPPRPGRARLRLALAPLLVVATIGYAFYDAELREPPVPGAAASNAAGLAVGLHRGELAPDFTVRDLQGNEAKLSDYRGRKVIVNFWASWCPPCRAEMPHMQRFYEAHAEDGTVALLSVNLASLEKGAGAAAAFAAKRGLSFPIYRDEDGALLDLYRIKAYPTTYVLDARGVNENIVVGPMTLDFLETLI